MVRTLFISFFALFTLSISLPGEAVSAKKLYDDFSTGYLSSDKWFPREYVKEISDGKLVLKLGNSSGMGAEDWPGMFRNNLGVVSPDPETITAFESEITIMEATPDSAPNSRSFARIAGQFYNSNESDGQYGEIAFEIMIGDRGNGGLEAFWEASRVMENDPSNFEQITSGTLIGPGTLDTGVPYLVKVVYDNDRTLTFTVNGVTDEYTGPEKKRPAVNPVRSIGACIDAADGSNDGFIHTTFDNVVFNNAAEIHEDFSSPLIDLSKWDQTEWVRECSNGHLRANVRRISGGRHASTYLTTGRDTPYLEAKVRIESDTQLSVGASGIARLGGYYYNETRGTGSGVDYNRYEGDVFAQIRLRYDSDGTIQAQAWIGRSDDADEKNFTDLFWHVFSTPIELDTYYVLSITYEDNRIIFHCEDEQSVFNIQTNAYPPYGMHRQLRTWLFADSGESGYFKASYDDIYIADPPVATSILSHTFPDHTITWGSNEQVYGTSTSNMITLESGAKAELINFPGQNIIQIQSGVDNFTMFRAGTVVIFQGTDGTTLKIPATTEGQSIVFTDRAPMVLKIHENQVILDDRVIGTESVVISEHIGYSGRTENYFGTEFSIAFTLTDKGISSIDVLDGPNIVATSGSRASLSQRPEPGDNYFIRVNYSDGTTQETSYTVDGVNDHPVVITSPEDFEIIETTDPTITWQQMSGTFSKYWINLHKQGDDEDIPVWFSGYLDPTTTSCIFNFNNNASESLEPGGTYKIYFHSFDEKGNQATTTSTFIFSDNENPMRDCGAYVAPGVWKEFDCYNLAAIGKTTGADPFTPSWELIGGYWQWGRKGPDPDEQDWYNTNTPNFAHGPTGPGSGEANEGSISGWDSSYAPNGALSDASKSANDPCPAGFRVPTKTQWDGVLNNNSQSTMGTWLSSATNYSSARSFGDKLLLPAAGERYSNSGALDDRSGNGSYWSSSENGSSHAWGLYFNSGYAGSGSNDRWYGFSVRCVAEDAPYSLTKTQVSEFYVIIFNRVSEGSGNAFWQSFADMDMVSDAMLNTYAAQYYFGDNYNTNQAFIEHIFLNTLNLTAADDPEVIAYWALFLDNGMSRGEVVLALIKWLKDHAPGGPYYDPNDTRMIAAYNQFINRVEVSNYAAEVLEEAPADFLTTIVFSESGLNVTDDPATVIEAKRLIDIMSGG